MIAGPRRVKPGRARAGAARSWRLRARWQPAGWARDVLAFDDSDAAALAGRLAPARLADMGGLDLPGA